MLPTFLIPGAGKSGTSSLWALLDEHPEVCMARVKEPGFFTREPGWRAGGDPAASTQGGRWDKGLAWYEGLFEGCDGALARGEASTVYMPAADAPALIRSVVPGVRLVFILRDPVERLHSQYWQERRHGWKLPPFERLVAEEHPRFRRYCHVSAYERHLARFLAEFPREQVHVFLYEDLGREPTDLVRRVYRSVGVDTSFEPRGLGRRHNVASQPRLPWLERVLSAPVGRRAGEALPDWVRGPLGRARRRLSALNRRRGLYAPMPAELRRTLAARFAPATACVETLLGRELPEWRGGEA